MNPNPDRLLFTDLPRVDESFVGYLLRLTELNYFNRLSWILDSSNLYQSLNSKTFYGIDSKARVDLLAKISGVEEQILKNLTYQIDTQKRGRQTTHYLLFGNSLPSFYFVQQRPRICPLCLREENYLRRMWEFAPLTTCIGHQCLLIDSCPGCRKPLTWNRSRVSSCLCDFDLRRSVPTSVSEKETRISKQIYLLCQLEEFDTPYLLSPILSKLNLPDLLKTLFFFACSLTKITNLSGKTLLERASNPVLHRFLISAGVIFDHFPQNFFIYLDMIKQSGLTHWSKGKQTFQNTDGLRGWQNVFEAFRISLIENFEGEQFQFIHQAFYEYLDLGRSGFLNWETAEQFDPQSLRLALKKILRRNRRDRR